MRARISYTVDVEEIPHKTSKLIADSSNVLHNIHEELNDLSLDLLADKKILATIEKIDILRQKLYKVDSLLQDVASILVGYEKALLGISETDELKELVNEPEEGWFSIRPDGNYIK